MCMAIFQDIGKKISKNQCLKYAHINRDGFGFAYVDKGKLIIKKTTNFDQFYIQYTIAVNQYGSKSPFIIHFRFGTSGLNNQDNCHPFLINKDTCFIHNGVFSELSNNPVLSDTNIFNRTVLQPLFKHNITAPTDRLLTHDTYNKLVFLNSQQQHLIINENLGLWDNGIWYSNRYFAFD